jgi:hypothetical protein
MPEPFNAAFALRYGAVCKALLDQILRKAKRRSERPLAAILTLSAYVKIVEAVKLAAGMMSGDS